MTNHYILTTCLLAGALAMMFFFWLDERLRHTRTLNELRALERQHAFMLAELPDPSPEPWQAERIEKAQRRKASAARGYHYDEAGRDGSEA